MRLWSLHPSLLDVRGLVALWREGLLAQHVLLGKTKGYRAHPQLYRFKVHRDPVALIASYLWEVHAEACRRGYSFDGRKIVRPKQRLRVKVTCGQIDYEFGHLVKKLRQRDPSYLQKISGRKPRAHPLFIVKAGDIEAWERI